MAELRKCSRISGLHFYHLAWQVTYGCKQLGFTVHCLPKGASSGLDHNKGLKKQLESRLRRIRDERAESSQRDQGTRRRSPPQELCKRTNKYMPKEKPEVEPFLHESKMREPYSVSVASTVKSKEPSKCIAITTEKANLTLGNALFPSLSSLLWHQGSKHRKDGDVLYSKKRKRDVHSPSPFQVLS